MKDADFTSGHPPPPRHSKLREAGTLASKAFAAWRADYAASMGAALSYYAFFSIAPLLVIVIAGASLVFKRADVTAAITAQLTGLLGEASAKAVQDMTDVAGHFDSGFGAIAVGVALLVIGATTVFAELQDDLDRVWNVRPKKAAGILDMVKDRLLSFGLVLGLGFLLVVSLVASAALAAAGKWWSTWLGGWPLLLEAVDLALSFGVLMALFAMIYKFVPRVPVAWNDVWTGAAVTAVLVDIGKYLIGLYLGHSAIGTGYGAAGALMVMLVWLYYSAQIFLLGAEFTYVYAHRHGSRRGQPRKSIGRQGKIPPHRDTPRPEAEP